MLCECLQISLYSMFIMAKILKILQFTTRFAKIINKIFLANVSSFLVHTGYIFSNFFISPTSNFSPTKIDREIVAWGRGWKEGSPPPLLQKCIQFLTLLDAFSEHFFRSFLQKRGKFIVIYIFWGKNAVKRPILVSFASFSLFFFCPFFFLLVFSPNMKFSKGAKLKFYLFMRICLHQNSNIHRLKKYVIA